MGVINLMMGKQRGGIEQAALDYAEALALAGEPCLSVLAPGSWAADSFAHASMPYRTVAQRGGWDVLAAYRLRRLIRQTGANVVLCHGNRALSLALLARPRRVRIVAIAHNYHTKRFHRADACFAITQHAAEALMARGIAQPRIHAMPNMVRVRDDVPARPDFRTPPRLGSMGRFVPKKAFDLYLQACAILKQRGIAFEATLGGGGDEDHALRQMVRDAGLEGTVTMPGWVRDKQAWFDALDLFILPSQHEPFGIVLIEAMAEKLPVIATASEGPREIIQSGANGLLTPLGDATALADAIAALLADPARARALGEAGAHDVATRYCPAAMAERLRVALHAIRTGN